MNLKLIFIIFTSLLIIVSAGVFWILMGNVKSKNAITQESSKSSFKNLILIPQEPDGKVLVESVNLSKKGFLVVRKVEDGKLSQVIEMSRPLDIGSHKNIEISLGRAEVNNSELIVMIYEDYANDDIFNDLDMPAIDENGFMTGRYVKTGKPLPASIAEGDSAGMSHAMKGAKTMAKVRYTDKGFVPDKVEVPEGSTVEFINESNSDMWVASMSHPAHTILPTFDQFKAYKKGAVYRYVFDKKGSWEFHDHINPGAGGVVNVI